MSSFGFFRRYNSGMKRIAALRVLLVGICLAILVGPTLVSAQSFIAKAQVLTIVSDVQIDTSTTTPHDYTEVVTARILDGSQNGDTVEFSNSYVDGDGQKLNPGDTIYVGRFLEDTSNNELTAYSYFSVDHDRMLVVLVFTALFLLCIFWIGGKQGIRGLISLAGGIGFIVFVLLPGVIHGYSPILLSIIVASFVASVGAYITHGFTRMTTAAVVGMIVTIIVAALLSQVAVHFGYLSGVTDETSFNLLSSPIPGDPPINFQGLLLGGIIIGILGVLYDAAIGQAVAVEELWRASPSMPRKLVYQRAFRIGREHIGALVNTLVLAYVGASLPVMISIYESLTYYSQYAMERIFNVEFIATEIIRTTAGSIGLMLAIPITTAIAVRILHPKSTKQTQ